MAGGVWKSDFQLGEGQRYHFLFEDKNTLENLLCYLRFYVSYGSLPKIII